MMAQHPTSIPLPAHRAPNSDSPIPPTPSAFPSLSGDFDPSSTAHQLPASTLHYAQVTGKVLPPSSIPKGISLPPPIHSTPTSTNSSSNSNNQQRERHQSSGQKNRDYPYARPGPGSRTHSGGKQGGADRRKSTKASTAKPQSEDKSTSEGQDKKHRNIPGMPPAWVARNSKTAPPQQGSHARRKSEGVASFVTVKEKDDEDKKKKNDQPGVPGKKKQKALGKSFDPAKSKLSALAPSFEFIPRSATAPNLSSYTQESSAGSESEKNEDHPEEEEETQESSSEETSSQNPSPSGSLAPFLSSSFSLSTPSSLNSLDCASPSESDKEAKDPAEGLVDEKLAAEIVSSAGPQADGFVGQSFTQSESGARPDADKTGFNPISGVINESPMADLEWKEKMGWWREDYDPKVPKIEEDVIVEEKEEEEEAELAPAAVEANSNETPLLQFPPWTPPSPSTPSEDVKIDLSDSTVSPAILSEVLPHSFSDASLENQPSPATSAPETKEPVVNSSQPSAPPENASVEPEPSTSSTPPEIPSLSSYLSTSFTPPLSGYPSTSTSFDSSYLSQDEVRAEKLAQEGPAEQAEEKQKEEDSIVPDMPLSAEAVAAQPTLDDALDVEELPLEGAEEDQPASKKEEKEVRKGWWNREEDETEKPQRNQAEHSDKMVDPELAKETVESAGAQADGFVEKGFEAVDRVGAEAQDGEKEIKKGIEQEAVEEESRRDVVDAGEVEAKEKGTSTPLGSFLSSAFQPTDTNFAESATNEETPVLTSTEENESPSSSSTLELTTSQTPRNPAPLARRRSSSPPPPPERRPSESHAADSAPSLTLAISSAWHTAPWSRKLWAIIASVAINVGLPFVNGVMLGFGELFARNVLGVRFGWPLHNNTSTTGSSSRANTGGVGLRSAGAYKTAGQGVGTDVPGHAGAKTALEGVVESVAE
ncbi:hypothetical protein JCM3765_006524 [Sporobolomyces pararoseus]